MLRKSVWLTLALVLTACGSPPVADAPPQPSLDITHTATAEPAPSATPSATAVSTPTPALSEWEQVQKQVAQYRSRFSRDSDGYAGLTLALEQAEPNQAWCGGLSAAISQFNYVNDTASASALTALKQSQNCP